MDITENTGKDKHYEQYYQLNINVKTFFFFVKMYSNKFKSFETLFINQTKRVCPISYSFFFIIIFTPYIVMVDRFLVQHRQPNNEFNILTCIANNIYF